MFEALDPFFFGSMGVCFFCMLLARQSYYSVRCVVVVCSWLTYWFEVAGCWLFLRIFLGHNLQSWYCFVFYVIITVWQWDPEFKASNLLIFALHSELAVSAMKARVIFLYSRQQFCEQFLGNSFCEHVVRLLRDSFPEHFLLSYYHNKNCILFVHLGICQWAMERPTRILITFTRQVPTPKATILGLRTGKFGAVFCWWWEENRRPGRFLVRSSTYPGY